MEVVVLSLIASWREKQGGADGADGVDRTLPGFGPEC